MTAPAFLLAIAVVLVALVFSLLTALVGILLLMVGIGLHDLIGVGGCRFYRSGEADERNHPNRR